VRLERLVDLVRLGDVLELVDVLDARPLFDLGDALVGECGGLGLLVDRVVVLGDQPGDEPCVRVVLLSGLVALPLMISGVRASSMRMESTSSTIA